MIQPLRVGGTRRKERQGFLGERRRVFRGLRGVFEGVPERRRGSGKNGVRKWKALGIPGRRFRFRRGGFSRNRQNRKRPGNILEEYSRSRFVLGIRVKFSTGFPPDLHRVSHRFPTGLSTSPTGRAPPRRRGRPGVGTPLIRPSVRTGAPSPEGEGFGRAGGPGPYGAGRRRRVRRRGGHWPSGVRNERICRRQIIPEGAASGLRARRADVGIHS